MLNLLESYFYKFQEAHRTTDSHEKRCNVNHLVLGFSRYTKFEAYKHWDAIFG